MGKVFDICEVGSEFLRVFNLHVFRASRNC
jgi:hypothetical protein